jgi:hypothetical protein
MRKLQEVQFEDTVISFNVVSAPEARAVCASGIVPLRLVPVRAVTLATEAAITLVWSLTAATTPLLHWPGCPSGVGAGSGLRTGWGLGVQLGHPWGSALSLCKEITVAKCREGKTRRNLVVGYG